MGDMMENDINKLKLILDINKINISRMDLVIVSTCFSQDFAEIFLELGAKNIIYIEKKTKVIDRISVLFLKYFYQYLTEGQNIEDSYYNAIKDMKLDKEILTINKNSCCCTHYHKTNCELNSSVKRRKIIRKINVNIMKVLN